MFYLNPEIEQHGPFKLQILKYILGQNLFGIVTSTVVQPDWFNNFQQSLESWSIQRLIII